MLSPTDMTTSLASALINQAAAMTAAQITALQQERLQRLLDYARQHSPYLREKYDGVPVCPALHEIPPMMREEVLPQLERWVCDREITTARLDDYLSRIDEHSALTPFLGRYRVLTTSGTTGIALRMIRDERHNLIHSALLNQRLLGGSKASKSRVASSPYPRTAGILASGGYHSTYLSFLRTKKAYAEAGRGDDIMALFLDMSTAQMVQKLNQFQPSLLTGYPSNMRVLAAQQKTGTLSISPSLIACSAEHLSLDDIAYIEQIFGCPVLNNYCSTEGGEVAMLCSENRMHVNADWVIVEPVDRDMRPVPDKTESDGVLITNLANLVQPVIRCYVSDRIVFHRDRCACGSPFPSIEIEGRKEDILSFRDGEGRIIQLPSSIFISLSMHTPNCAQVQFIQYGEKNLEIRCIPENGEGHEALCHCLAEGAQDALLKEGLEDICIQSSLAEPILGKTVKMRNTMRLTDAG